MPLGKKNLRMASSTSSFNYTLNEFVSGFGASLVILCFSLDSNALELEEIGIEGIEKNTQEICLGVLNLAIFWTLMSFIRSKKIINMSRKYSRNRWPKEIKSSLILRPRRMIMTTIDHLNLTIIRNFKTVMNRRSNSLHGS